MEKQKCKSCGASYEAGTVDDTVIATTGKCVWCSDGRYPDKGSESGYDVKFKDARLDPYRIIQCYGITHPAHQHALKKLLRAGRSHKPLVQDIIETIHSLQRWLGMIEEDAK
jgi:hypothetical protein